MGFVRPVSGGCKRVRGYSQAFFPPTWHHEKYTQRQSASESGQDHQHQRRFPERAKKEMHRNRLLVIQCKSKKGKKNGCLKQPREIFHW